MVIPKVLTRALVLCCSKLWAYSSTIFNALVWSMEFPFLGVKCHIYHICHTLFLSPGQGHTLVLPWSTSFGFGPSLEYSIWVWFQSEVLTLVISCNPINPGVLDWVSHGFSWHDMSNLFFFFIFSISLSLFGCHVCSSLFFLLFICYICFPCPSKKSHKENS